MSTLDRLFSELAQARPYTDTSTPLDSVSAAESKGTINYAYRFGALCSVLEGVWSRARDLRIEERAIIDELRTMQVKMNEHAQMLGRVRVKIGEVGE